MKESIIAESGSTKCTWKLPDGTMVNTIGLNPYLADEALIAGAIEGVPQLEKAARLGKQLIFFGAGCGPDEASVRMISLLQPYFPKAEMTILSDMEAAALALLKNKEGLVGILGTGSNVGYYQPQNRTWHYTIPSLGWALADEGGGVSLGKALLKAFTRKRLSRYALTRLEELPDLTLPFILDKLYRQPMPNRYLASFAPTILELSSDSSVFEQVIQPVFKDFALNVVLPSAQSNRCNSIVLAGSIAYHFQEFVSSSLVEAGIELTEVCASPIDRLSL